jgi:ABC-type uncharacterized transport system permease subunit
VYTNLERILNLLVNRHKVKKLILKLTGGILTMMNYWKISLLALLKENRKFLKKKSMVQKSLLEISEINGPEET